MYVKNPGTVQEYIANTAFIRIRVQNKTKIYLTVKRPMTRSAEELVKHEYETSVDSLEQAQGMLALLELHLATRIHKTRLTTDYGEYEICLDEVEDLGSFIELEKMGEADDARAIQSEMNSFLETLGVTELDRVTKGYDILMLEKKE